MRQDFSSVKIMLQEFEQATGEFERLTPDYIKNMTFQPPVDLSCLTLPNFRAYAYVKQDENTGRDILQLAPGITAVLDKTLPQEWKCEWYGRVGLDVAKRTLRERQAFGTLLHGQTAHFDIDQSYNFDDVLEIVPAFLESHPLPFTIDLHAWLQELQEDMASYIRWSQIVDFEPLAVEIPLVSERYNVASRIDKVGFLNIGSEGYYASGKNKYQPKGDIQRVLAIVDVKSSRKNHSNAANPLQVLFYEHLFKANFPSLQTKDIRLFNWFPSGWQNTPEYTFKEHYATKGVVDDEKKAAALRELEMCIELFHLRHSWTKNRTRFFGTFSAKEAGNDIMNNYRRESYLELLANELTADLPDELQTAI